MLFTTFIFKLALTLFVALILSLIFNSIKQPLIIAYIIAGIIISSYLITSLEIKNTISIFSELGVAFMLFIVGLELKLKIINEIGKKSLLIGTLQEIFTILFGFLLALFLGFNYLEAIYLGIALSFSSTIIMVKLISDKGDLEKYYGKLAIGFLIIQDLITILLLIIFPFLPFGNQIINLNNLIYSLLLIFIVPFLGIRLLPKFERTIAKSKEVTFLFAITFLLLTASLFEVLGIGLEAGALIAGISLANLSISPEISLRLKPLKDFFLIIFFIYTGFNIFIPHIGNYFYQALYLSLFVIILNPLIMYVLSRLIKIDRKTSFFLGLTSAQISEFSFIFIALGNSLGHIKNELLSLISLIGIVTIFVSTYMIYYSEKIYNLIFKRIFKTKREFKINEKLLKDDFEILLIGCDRTGYSFLINLLDLKDKILIIENNYDKFKKLLNNSYKVIYADASEVDLWEIINLSRFKLIFSTIPDFETNLFILENYKNLRKRGIFICNSVDYYQTLQLYQKGADYVNMHNFLGGEKISELVKKFAFINENYEAIKKEDFEKIEIILKYLNSGK